jgi:predicted enzyme related to lactoylglutathione lyase
MEIRGADFVVYQVSDMERSIAFYRDTLGLELETHAEEYGWAEFKAPPTTLSLYAPGITQPGATPQTGGGSLALSVNNVEAALEELRGKGVTVVMDAFESPVCHYALVADPDGNAVGIHCRKDGSCG